MSAAACWFILLLAGLTTSNATADPAALPDWVGPQGGLVVQVGADDLSDALALARTGRCLVQVFDAEPANVQKAKQTIAQAGLYGLATADELPAAGKLPYAENLVNAIYVRPGAMNTIPPAELARVLRPLGRARIEPPELASRLINSGGLAVEVAGTPAILSKAWPEAMDDWSHPRHAADGNAVSNDQQTGPARRVRWVFGPPQEISNMVTSRGNYFVGGVLARDAFNGLRRWQRELSPSPARGGFTYKNARGAVRPVAVGGDLLAYDAGRLAAFDGATGRILREYPAAGAPNDLMACNGMIVAVDEITIRAVDYLSGELCWKLTASNPRCVVAGDGGVYYLAGEPRKGETVELTAVELMSGKPLWRQTDYDWLPKVRQCVYHDGLLTCELSTLNDDKPGNLIHVLAAADGRPKWQHTFIPSMAHMKQARAMFAGGLLWVLDDHRCRALELTNGEVLRTYPAGWGHCFPPVATQQYLFSGELNMTSLTTGQVDANRITKGACGRDAGFVVANGLIYTFPKHCTCWPMLRDYAALAPEKPEPTPPSPLRFTAVAGPATAPTLTDDPAEATDAWPCYRHDALRSGATAADVPAQLAVKWRLALGDWPESPAGGVAEDWRVNSFVRSPLGPPVVCGGLVYVARPDEHRLIAVHLATGKPAWDFIANGRIDTAPTIHGGLCLFGTRNGWAYCLRADNGALVWRMRIAPEEERIVAYGQVESPWPVPGTILVTDGVAYLAAGRQPLADGGIIVLAFAPATGQVKWAKRLASVPQTEFYGSQGLEFDNFDILQREGDRINLSRWFFNLSDGAMQCDMRSGFARLGTAGGGVMFPRGSWSYAPRDENEQSYDRPHLRPLVVFDANQLFSLTEDKQSLFRRDFALDQGEKFDTDWCVRWNVLEKARKGGDLWRSDRLAHAAQWKVSPTGTSKTAPRNTALVLTRQSLFVANTAGQLSAIDRADGKVLGTVDVGAPATWDGLAAVSGSLVLSTARGELICLGPAE